MDITQFPGTDETGFRLLKPVSYELTVTKFDDTVTIEGPVDLAASLACGRCLEEFDVELSLTMSIKLFPRYRSPGFARDGTPWRRP